jgi:hypothetical protein
MHNVYNLIFTFLDDALELLKVAFPNFQALATGATVLIILIRIYKKWKKQREPVSNTDKLEYMIRYLYQKEGGTWPVDSNGLMPTIPSRSLNYSHRIRVTFAAWCMRLTTIRGYIRRMKKMKSKLSSRKFWMAVATAVLIVLNEGLDLGIDQETVLAFAGIIATYILGEAAVDATRNRKVDQARAEVAATSDPDEEIKLY